MNKRGMMSSIIMPESERTTSTSQTSRCNHPLPFLLQMVQGRILMIHLRLLLLLLQMTRSGSSDAIRRASR